MVEFDDTYVVCSPERVMDIFAIIQLFAHVRISHHGKTQVVSPELTLPFAELHDRKVWQWL